MRLNIIGLGRLGKTLARLFIAHDLLEVQSICSINQSNVHEFIRETKQGQAYRDIREIPRAAITMISTPDNEIERVALNLSMNLNIQPGDIFFHCSGLLSSNALLPIRDRGGIIASAHPLRSFTHHVQESYAGTYCAIEGEQQATAFLQNLFKKIGFIPFIMNCDKKVLYHAGAVFASNYLVTLFHQATRCIEAADVSPEMSKEIVLSLMQGTLENLKNQDAGDALTGPLMRGDTKTIAAHLDVLNDAKALYQELAKATLPLTQHMEETLHKLRQLLD